ncbi:monovalent cation/H(+) antiporter subunit G [Saccharicrinis aurantiacus]|uniref:monovalent cation/H(+) antiporter subunit G n=1 Tax=Saccharicrinis aurantiacus TaxID=1849719 RepID=UPI0024918F10|nr:monovalent cation/H(+) antiporter subunit G [Saccharicrinis aurantiacus]
MEIVIIILLAVGSLLMLLGAIGLNRFPDIFMRMHAATKAPSLGALLMLMAFAFYFSDMETSIKAIVIIVFIFLTTPIASHAIAATAHRLKVKKWDKMEIDDLERDRKKN